MELKRILFIVPGERQAGACGVVDNAFQMAVAAAKSGAEVLILPLYPAGKAEKDFFENLDCDLRPLITLKAVKGEGVIQRIAQFRAVVQDYRPDCISLQFYPKLFKVGRRYLPALKELTTALQGWPVTVTMHETWTKLGEAGAGCWIKKSIRSHDLKKGLRHLNPRMMLVSNERHFQQVTRAGFTAGKLPIVSNIEKHELSPGMDLASLLVRMDADAIVPENPLSILFFARIIPTWDPAPLLAALRAEAEKTGANPVIISVGETGYGDVGWQNLLKNAGNIPCVKLGKRSAGEISWLLQSCDFGFSPTPADFWMKSSSCAAMMTHDLPIIFSEKTCHTALPPRSWVTDRDGFKPSKSIVCKSAYVTCVNEVWKRFASCAASVCFSPPIHHPPGRVAQTTKGKK